MRSILALVAVTFAAGCTVNLAPSDLVRDSEPDDQGPNHAYEQAARISGVPMELLLAISHVESGLQMVEGMEEFEGMPPAYGLMGLRGEQLEEAAALARISVDEAMFVRDENVLAAAMLLAEYADEDGIDTSDLGAWAPVVARFSGIEDDEAAAEYVHYEVYATLQEGLEIEGLSLPPQDVRPDFRSPLRQLNQRLDDATSIWTPSPNHNSRSGRVPEYVIIHTCEGTYSGCWGWLVNSASKVSAHYVVNDDGSEVRQLVDEDDRAWHASADYDCGNNASVDCDNNGTSMNTLGVGIEHAGYANQSSWNSGLIQRSAELTCGITQRNNIPRDSYHIIGHGQIQPWNRTDPGPNWPWTDYLERIQVACGDVAGSGSSSVPAQVEIDETLDASTGAEDIFAIDVPAGAKELRVTLEGTNGDADLFVNDGTVVSQNLWGCRSITNTSNEECVLSNPTEGTYSILVHAYKTYSGVRLTAAVDGGTGSAGSTGTGTGGTGGSWTGWGNTGLPSTFVIDSNNAANDSDWWIDVGPAWSASASVSGYYNTGYWYARTAQRSDTADFAFVSEELSCFQVEAWWTSGSDRGMATFIAYDENDNELGRSLVDQTVRGGQWNHLGYWTFPGGTNRVALSSWGDGAEVVIADAVRVSDSVMCH